MKILVICHEFPPMTGGGGVVAYTVGKELAKKHQVDVLTAKHGHLPAAEHRDGVKIYRCPVLGSVNLEKNTVFNAFISFFSFVISASFSAIRLTILNRYQAVYTFFVIPSGFIGLLLSKLFKINHISTIIEADVLDPRQSCLTPYRNPVIKHLISFILCHATSLVSISGNIREVVKMHYDCAKDIKVINSFFEPVDCARGGRQELDISEKDFVIISTGRLVERKGFEYLIKAVHKLGLPGIKTFIIGDGPLKAFLKELSDKLKLNSSLKILGYLSDKDKFRYLAAGDIFVLPSLHEGLGIAFMEAMACGLPVVTTDSGGQTDIVVDGRNGFLVPVRDPDELAKIILVLYNNRSLIKTISENNIAEVRKYFVSTLGEQYGLLAEG